MYKHPAVRWVNTIGPKGEVRESYMVERSGNPLAEWNDMKVAPVAEEGQKVVDCKLL